MRRKVNFTSSPMDSGSRLVGFGLECGLLGFVLGYWPTQGAASPALGVLTGTVSSSFPGTWAIAGSKLVIAAPVGNQAAEVGVTTIGSNGQYRIRLNQGNYSAVLILPNVKTPFPQSPSAFSVFAGQQVVENFTYSTAGL
jgi:hypothetical protein